MKKGVKMSVFLLAFILLAGVLSAAGSGLPIPPPSPSMDSDNYSSNYANQNNANNYGGNLDSGAGNKEASVSNEIIWTVSGIIILLLIIMLAYIVYKKLTGKKQTKAKK